MNQIAPKPMQPASSATEPGTNSAWKLNLAASSGPTACAARARSSSTVPSSRPPKKISPRKRLIICSPWLTAIAKIRNGVSMFIGSMPKPISGSVPSIHTTDTSAHSTVSEASFTELEYRNSSSHVKAMVKAKNFSTERAPSLMSPTILAKPMMWIWMLPFSCFWRIASSWRAIAW